MERTRFSPESAEPRTFADKIAPYKKRIMTYDDFLLSPFVKNELETLQYTATSGKQSVTVVGMPYIFDAQHPLFIDLVNHFEEADPDIVMVEGILAVNNRTREVADQLIPMPIEKAKKYGVGIFVLKLASDQIRAGKDIDFESPEPELRDLINFLEDKGFDRQDIYNYFVLRDASQYFREEKEHSQDGLLEYIAPFIERFRTESNWDENECIRFEEEISEQLILDGAQYEAVTDPVPWPGKPYSDINKIAAAASRFREEYVFERIARAIEHHSRVFIVYESKHAVVLEPAIKAFMADRRP